MIKNSLGKLQYNSPVVLTIFFLSFIALILDILTSGWTTINLFTVYRSSMLNPLFYVRLLGHIVGHSGWEHFMGNMLLLLVVGPPLEEKYGSANLGGAVLATAVVTGVLQCLLFVNGLHGASGIVFMMIMLASLAGMRENKIPLTLILVAILYLGEQVLSIIFVRDNVANLMHIVGGVCGTIFGLVSLKIRKKY